jgi:hypothetical protein
MFVDSQHRSSLTQVSKARANEGIRVYALVAQIKTAAFLYASMILYIMSKLVLSANAVPFCRRCFVRQRAKFLFQGTSFAIGDNG